MTEAEVELILQRAWEQFPQASPRIISDNGPQFIARDFKEFIRMCGMTHVRTSPFYPQSNGKIERWHQSLKSECVRPGVPLSIDDARRLVERYVNYYNRVRLHSAIGYVTPRDKLEGREAQIFAERDRKLEDARQQRQIRRQGVGKTEYRWRLVGPAAKLIAPGETEAGSAGKQPCRGITRWAHRDDEVGACEHCSAPPYHSSADLIRAIDPDALKILARRAKHLCLTKNGDSPFPAEPEQFPSVVSSERSRVDNKMTGQTTGGIQMLECSPPREGRKGSPGKETVGFLPLVRQRIMAGQPLPSAAGTNLRSKSKFQISLVRIRVLKTMVELRRINFRHQRR